MICPDCGKEALGYWGMGIYGPIEHGCPARKHPWQVRADTAERRVAELEAKDKTLQRELIVAMESWRTEFLRLDDARRKLNDAFDRGEVHAELQIGRRVMVCGRPGVVTGLYPDQRLSVRIVHPDGFESSYPECDCEMIP